MKRRYTVVWIPSAQGKLAQLWNENPAIRLEIADSADEIDASLAQDPLNIGIPTEGVGRLVVRPPFNGALSS